MSAILGKLLAFVAGKKVLYLLATVVIEAVLAAARAHWPDATLPSAEQVLALGAGLIACHTITDVVAIIKDAILAYAQTPKTK